MRTPCVFATAAIVLASAGVANAAITADPFPAGDAGFLALTDNGALEEAAAESRIGNAQTNGGWEVAVWEQGGVGQPKDQDQLALGNGDQVPFVLSYDGVSTVTFSVGSASASWDMVAEGFTDIFIRARAADGSTVSLTGMDLNGTAIPDLVASGAGSSSVEYLRIQNMGADFGAFSLLGTQELAWSGDMPMNSALAYQIKLTNVPTPGAGALLAVAGLAAVRRRRA
jgi:MYXO-CTERM domain-containing protein